ncbi:NahK/ErcS family hybrid sensor histidine kinase/response regulator [uncultured Ferrovibrio sp.]|jgi:PAS domain S-box-containing protein|uniref:NahK/ErcS family hybrid sensor histidine kinase/response regulator n=1 Tax=uncultured Ferrovibrio sp. TaxID=1576913 RepID=UPI002603376A|nr:NahK/ErcS family hybrid sensor histidine kinase/response regulator [uncultured Ferrovibrio sp.]
MLQGSAILLLSLGYLGLLFAIAHLGDRLAPRWYQGRSGATIYALSLAIYCTSWTFYGSVGRAALSGPDFILIYVGPVLAITLGYPVMGKMIAVAKRQNVTSIADFIGSRYGKSRAVAVLVTLFAVIGVLPYISLQMQAVSVTFEVLVGSDMAHLLNASLPPPWRDTAMFVAGIMALFTILFGVRHVQATEQHRGMMLAIAFESLVKLAAFLAVGFFIVYGVFDSGTDLLQRVQASPALAEQLSGNFGTSWIAMTFLSAFAFLCLPRQFHVAVVENGDTSSLKAARWLFPIYLVAINLFVMPIAAAGLLLSDSESNPDLFVITIPLMSDQVALSVFAFIGGLSAATSMVIVACMALSTMVSNELVTPFLLRSRAGGSREVGQIVLNVRRAAVVVILVAAYIYHTWIAGYLPLASMGMISFCAVANFAPALLLGLYWRGAHRHGVIIGLLAGFAVWFYALVLPSIEGAASGQALTAPLTDLLPPPIDGFDPILQGFVASVMVNLLLLITVSLASRSTSRDVEQAVIFTSGGESLPAADFDADLHDPRIDELRALAARFIGPERADRAFAGRRMSPAEAMAFTEHLLGGAIGAASARIVMASARGKNLLSPRAARAMLGEASEAIRHNFDLLRTTLDHISQGLGVFDRDGQLAAWNDRFFDLLGLPVNRAEIGTPLQELAGDAAPELIAMLSSGAAGSRILEQRRPDGKVIEIRIDPMPDGGFVATCTDISERVRAAEALRDSERAMRVYTDNVPVLIAYVDNQERYRFANVLFRRALNLMHVEIEGHTIQEMLSPERYQRLKPRIDAALAGERQSFDMEFEPNDANIEVAHGTYIPHIDEKGQVLGFFLLYQDITERRRADAALRAAYEGLERRVAERTAELQLAVQELEHSRADAEAANLGKTRFLAAASHDLLQPLHAARLFTAALAEREPDNPLVSKIDHGLGAVEALLDALLDISKLDAGQVKPEVRPVALGPLLDSLTAAFAPLAARNGVTLRLVPTSATISTDPSLLRRVLQNFVANAIRYTRADRSDRRVLIGCRRVGNAVRIEVCDNGPGIPDDKREVIFQEFARLNHGGDAAERGLGLGLAIVERIARKLESPIGLRSRVGHGSIFSITVPRAAVEPVQPAVSPSVPDVITGSLSGSFMLCIENEAGVREAMTTLLEGWSCTVAAVDSVEAARQEVAAAGRSPDVILADLHLDEGAPDGLEAIALLRRDWGQRIPAILITADRSQDMRQRAAAMGVDVLHKPVRPAALRALISQRRRPAGPLAETGD